MLTCYHWSAFERQHCRLVSYPFRDLTSWPCCPSAILLSSQFPTASLIVFLASPRSFQLFLPHKNCIRSLLSIVRTPLQVTSQLLLLLVLYSLRRSIPPIEEVPWSISRIGIFNNPPRWDRTPELLRPLGHLVFFSRHLRRRFGWLARRLIDDC